MERFDPQSGPATWSGLKPNDTVDIGSDLAVIARSNNPATSPDSPTKALTYTVRQTTYILNPDFPYGRVFL